MSPLSRPPLGSTFSDPPTFSRLSRLDMVLCNTYELQDQRTLNSIVSMNERSNHA